jgi:hypothetical protein
MTDTDWRDLIKAYESILHSNIKRIDGDKWTVYKAGNVIRIDIKP